MNIAIRVDASPAIGTGHLRRCLALAQALGALGQDVAFVTRDLGLDSARLIRAAGSGRIAVLPAPARAAAPASAQDRFEPDPAIAHSAWAQVTQAQDIAQTRAALESWAPEWKPDRIVVDSYAFDARWHRAAAAQLGCPVAAIDDLADRAMACDILIDHTLDADHRRKYASVAERPTRILGGPRFALLAPAFATAKPYAFHERVRSVGVFMGGVDPGNHSAAALKALALAGFDGPVELVATSANPQLAALREAVAARPDTRLSLDLPDLAGFFARHDLQIGAGGGASWERCCVGAPTLLTVIAPNQSAVAPILAQAGVVALSHDPSPENLAEALSDLLGNPARRRALAQASRALVDGQGAERAALALLAGTLRVRPATRKDARLMFDWRGHPATRCVSATRDPLDWEGHEAWLESALADRRRHLMVGEIGGRAVGVIRFDFEAQARPGGRAEVSLYCDPQLHGLGLGAALLHAGEAAADPGLVEARVMPGNLASHKLFQRCGYRRRAATRWEKQRVGAETDASPPRHGLIGATAKR